jgi:phage shock protein PspC (stress-responsive transcriptional regulator)
MVRFFWVMSILFLGTGLLAYLVLAVCLPREDRIAEAYDRLILGVCSHLARRSNLEVGLVRAGFVFMACFTAGAVVVAYFALYFILPKPDQTTPKPF